MNPGRSNDGGGELQEIRKTRAQSKMLLNGKMGKDLYSNLSKPCLDDGGRKRIPM